MRCHFIPGCLLERPSQAPDETVAESGRHTAAIDEAVRSRPAAAAPAGVGAWQIHDAQDGSTLPGGLVLSSGDPAPGLVVQVVRSGGFAGQRKEGAVDLDSADPRARDVRRLVQRIDFRAVGTGEPRPDRFVYRFSYLGLDTVVHEPELTDDLRELARIVLAE